MLDCLLTITIIAPLPPNGWAWGERGTRRAKSALRHNHAFQTQIVWCLFGVIVKEKCGKWIPTECWQIKFKHFISASKNWASFNILVGMQPFSNMPELLTTEQSAENFTMITWTIHELRYWPNKLNRHYSKQYRLILCCPLQLVTVVSIDNAFVSSHFQQQGRSNTVLAALPWQDRPPG